MPNINVKKTHCFFFSLLPLSCMEVPIRELVNTLFPTDSLLILSILNSSNIDMDINTSEGRLFSLSKNNSRELSTHSKTFFIPYYERMEIQNFNTFWSKQVENNKKERLSLLYVTPRVKKGNTVNEAINTSPNERILQDNNEAPILNNLLCLQGEDEVNNITNICNFQEFVNALILYGIN